MLVMQPIEPVEYPIRVTNTDAQGGVTTRKVKTPLGDFTLEFFLIAVLLLFIAWKE